MDRYILDSSIILDILAGNQEGQKAVKALAGGELATSVICYCEVLNKINLERYQKAEEFLSKLLVFGLSVGDGEIAKNLQLECRKSGGHVPTIDCLIAATAVSTNSVIAASDKDFERIQKIRKILF